MALKLSDIQSAARKSLKPLELLDDEGNVIVTLQPILALPKEQRMALGKAVDFRSIILDLVEEGEEAEEDERDMYDLMREALRLTVKAGDEADFDRLEEMVGDDPVTWENIFRDYNKETMPGEAKSSDD